MLKPADFFDLAAFEHAALFQELDFVWDALKRLEAYLKALLEKSGSRVEGEIHPQATLAGNNIVIGQGTVVEAGAYIAGPAYIGRDCHIRHGAYIRGQALIGEGCVVGHASEVKHSIMLDESGAPHFAYVGDSILGNRVNLGAGTRLSNLTVVSLKDPTSGRRPTLKITVEGATYDTGLTKLGAILGDEAQTGCNSVLNPGCLIGRRTLIYANASLRKGYYPPDHVIKLRQTVEVTRRR